MPEFRLNHYFVHNIIQKFKAAQPTFIVGKRAGALSQRLAATWSNVGKWILKKEK